MQDGRGRGTLYVVATPIGNLDDLPPRAREVLASVSLIAAEDTRRTARLLSRFEVDTPQVSFHEHNEDEMAERLLARLEAGEDIALVSDAGTPAVSDPGYRLLAAARDAGVVASPVPGACAAIAALSIAGLPSDRFIFEGFLPSRDGQRRRRLQALEQEARTVIFYLSVHRLKAELDDLVTTFGAEREATLARELTKFHEDVRHGTLGGLLEQAGSDPDLGKGETVLVVRGAAARLTQEDDAGLDRLLSALLAHLSAKDAVTVAVAATGRSKNEVYRRAQALKERA